MDGILIIDKPAGPTSHDIVAAVRRLTGVRKVGHLGTLDPAATGVLPLALGRATKAANRFSGATKAYEFTLRLGQRTETDDDAGRLIREAPVPADVLDRLRELLPAFRGEIRQRPPDYSAVKVGGRRAYELARKGRPVPLKERTVVVETLQVLDCNMPDIKMFLSCSSGTYVRGICRDLGEELGCGGHARDIRRVRHGHFALDEAVPLEALEGTGWRAALISIPLKR